MPTTHEKYQRHIESKMEAKLDTPDLALAECQSLSEEIFSLEDESGDRPVFDVAEVGDELAGAFRVLDRFARAGHLPSAWRS